MGEVRWGKQNARVKERRVCGDGWIDGWRGEGVGWDGMGWESQFRNCYTHLYVSEIYQSDLRLDLGVLDLATWIYVI